MACEGVAESRAGRWVGALVFAVGLALLLVVFGLAAAAFAALPEAIAAGPELQGQGVGPALALAGGRALFLFVMAYAGSLVASKGLEMHYRARGTG